MEHRSGKAAMMGLARPMTSEGDPSVICAPQFDVDSSVAPQKFLLNQFPDQESSECVPLENSEQEDGSNGESDFVCAPVTNFDKDTMTVKYSEAPRGSFAKQTKSDESPGVQFYEPPRNLISSESEQLDKVDFMDSQANFRRPSTSNGLQASGSGLYGDAAQGASQLSQQQPTS